MRGSAGKEGRSASNRRRIAHGSACRYLAWPPPEREVDAAEENKTELIA